MDCKCRIPLTLLCIVAAVNKVTRGAAVHIQAANQISEWNFAQLKYPIHVTNVIVTYFLGVVLYLQNR